MSDELIRSALRRRSLDLFLSHMPSSSCGCLTFVVTRMNGQKRPVTDCFDPDLAAVYICSRSYDVKLLKHFRFSWICLLHKLVETKNKDGVGSCTETKLNAAVSPLLLGVWKVNR